MTMTGGRVRPPGVPGGPGGPVIVQLSRDNRTVRVGGSDVVLTAAEWTVLLRLCPGQMATSGALIRALYDDLPDELYRRALATVVWRLRRKLGLASRSQPGARIRNCHRAGYRMEGVTVQDYDYPLLSTELLDWMGQS